VKAMNVKRNYSPPAAANSILEIKSKVNPTTLEKFKLIRYYMNHEKYSKDRIVSELPSWPKGDVQQIIEEIEKENQKPLPKRYFVSLKEPLDDNMQ
jgi:hypothetical protein